MDFLEYNRKSWDHQVEKKDRWTIPVSKEEIDDARKGNLTVDLTPVKQVPSEWLGAIPGKDILCLASGGGQQVPLFAAAGATVTSFDLSDKQLQQDLLTCREYGLEIKTQQGDMKDLSVFADGSFDLIFHPCSNCFIDDVHPVWKECFRVLKKGGDLLSGFCNPYIYLFDPEKKETEQLLQVKYPLPYSDIHSLSEEERKRYTSINDPLNFSHTLTDQIGGQLKAGFHLVDMYEDSWGGNELEDRYFSSFIATRSRKPG